MGASHPAGTLLRSQTLENPLHITRVATSAALIAFFVVAMTACAPSATPEEQAVAEFKSFVKASANGGEFNFCEGSEEDPSQIGASRINEDTEIEVEPSDNQEKYPGRYVVRALVHPLDGPDETRKSSMWVQVTEGEDPCVQTVIGYVW